MGSLAPNPACHPLRSYRSVGDKESTSTAAFVTFVMFSGCSADVSVPEPDSPAERYCDTNSEGSNTVVLGGKRYDKKCLDSYPWK